MTRPRKPAALVGAWRLVSVTLAGDGTPTPRNVGSGPDGMIIYAPGGHMTAHIVLPARDGAAAPSHHAYFGTYSVDPVSRTITHHRFGNNNPGLPTDVSRGFQFLGDGRLVLTPHGGRGDQLTFELAGRR